MKIGVVGKPYGLRGAFYVSGRSDALQLEFSKVSIGPSADQGLQSVVKEQKIHKSRTILILKELPDRTAMEKYLGKPIWILEKEIQVDHESEYLWKDLVGKSVVDSNGENIGVVKYVSNHGASDIVELENEAEETIDIAFIPAYFDMNFSKKDKSLKLIVPKENFEDFWQSKTELVPGGLTKNPSNKDS